MDRIQIDFVSAGYDKEMAIGADHRQAFTQNFAGILDEVRIWKIPRSHHLIRQNFRLGISPDDFLWSDLVLYYTFDSKDDQLKNYTGKMKMQVADQSNQQVHGVLGVCLVSK